MSDIVGEWFRTLYEDAIEETKSAIGNERIWQIGATTDDEVEMHEQNIRNLEEYIEAFLPMV